MPHVFTPVPGHALLRMRGIITSALAPIDEVWVNTLHIRTPAGLEATQAQMLRWAELAQGYAASVAANRTQQWRYTGSDIRALDAASRPTYHDEDDEVGAQPGDPLPWQISLAVTKVAAQPPLKPRLGRCFLNGFGEVDNTADGLVSGAALVRERDDFATFLRSIRNDATAPGVPVVLGYFHTGGGGSGYVSTDITSVRVGTVWDTQRRRRNAIPEAYSEVAL